MKWLVRDVTRLVGTSGPDWTIIGAVVICWMIYTVPLVLGILLEGVLPTHWVPG